MEIKGLSLADELRMLRGIEPITPKKADAADPLSPERKADFLEFLKTQLSELNQLGLEAEQKVQDSVEGKADNPQETVIALQKADVSFRLLLTIRDQLEQAYQQIIRSSIG
jgi:flagellar hook-basal body complex protein FliE